MRRDMFLKSLAACAATAGLPLSAAAAPAMRISIPAGRDGGWDKTGRALGSAMREAGVASRIAYANVPGAAGAFGLVQFINGAKGDPDAMLVMGAVMLGGIILRRPPVNLSQITAIARLASEYNVFVVPATSPFKDMAAVVAQLRMDPASVTWGGGSRGSTEHIAAAMIARAAGVDPRKLNYVAFDGGGEAAAAVAAGAVTIGGSGYSEFAGAIRDGRMRPVAVTSGERLRGIAIPTLREQGLDVEIGNWRGVYGAPGITFEQRSALIDRVRAAVESRSWQQALQANGWTPALLTGASFDRFVDHEFESLRTTMRKAGIV
jgi:putative tricarboxylic transport membrane protein